MRSFTIDHGFRLLSSRILLVCSGFTRIANWRAIFKLRMLEGLRVLLRIKCGDDCAAGHQVVRECCLLVSIDCFLVLIELLGRFVSIVRWKIGRGQGFFLNCYSFLELAQTEIGKSKNGQVRWVAS